MEYEIELKLLTDENAGEVIETKLLPELKASITSETLELTNYYFDTPARTLRHHDIGLRIRGNNQRFEQTLKTAGKSIGGLHQRPEYNVELDESQTQDLNYPNLRLFPNSAWPKTLNVDEVQASIETLFTTHFQRKVYLLEFLDGDVVELVWDLGEVTSGNKSIPICEIELELKKGETKSLFDLAERIVELMPTTMGIHSKAARGYSLIDTIVTKQSNTKIADKYASTEEELSSLLTGLLQKFQALSIEIRQQYCEDLVTSVNDVLVDLVDVSTKFSQHFPCSCLDRIQDKLENLRRNWSCFLERSNKIDACNLLIHADTTLLQLDMVRFLVERPWLTKE